MRMNDWSSDVCPSDLAKEAPVKQVDSAKDTNTSKVQMVMPDVAKNGIFSKMSTKKQQQALILIEEADILYKAYGQFWSNILNLIATTSEERSVGKGCVSKCRYRGMRDTKKKNK